MLYKSINGDYKTFSELPKQGNKVYYVSSVDEQSQYVKMFKDNGLDAIILEHNIDAHFVSFLEYKETDTKFVRIDSEIGEALKTEGSDVINETVVEIFKKSLNKEKLTVTAQALKTSDTPAIITINEYERRMSDISKIYGNMFGNAGPASETLIVNTDNSVVKKLPALDSEKQELLCKHIYDLALISQRKLTAEELDGFISRSVEVLGFIG